LYFFSLVPPGNSLPKNVFIRGIVANIRCFSDHFGHFDHICTSKTYVFPKKARPPPPKKFEGLILKMSTYTLFGRSMRQFHHTGSESHCPAAIAVGLLQNTVQKPEALPALWMLARDSWSGTVGLFGTCPALTPPKCLPGRLVCRKTPQGLGVQTTFLLANARYACSLSYGECSE
jgi:hypothetical protein